VEHNFKFDDIHPDPLIAREVVVDLLAGLLYEARAAMTRALDYNAVTPNGISIKNTLRHALESTSEDAITKRIYHEQGVCGQGPDELSFKR
jgi:hypothetical protein